MTEPNPHDLVELAVADDSATWISAGFHVDADSVVIGPTTVRLVGESDPRGIRTVSVLGVGGPVDGLPFAPATALRGSPAAQGPAHPNGVVAIDHLVVLSPDMDRTTEALESSGLEARRTRRFDAGGTRRRQTFFWLGTTILELAGADEGHGEGPATLWGLALTCGDLEASASHLGNRLGSVKPAVQTRRRIATLRTRDLGISIPIALMSPHPPVPHR